MVKFGSYYQMFSFSAALTSLISSTLDMLLLSRVFWERGFVIAASFSNAGCFNIDDFINFWVLSLFLSQIWAVHEQAISRFSDSNAMLRKSNYWFLTQFWQPWISYHSKFFLFFIDGVDFAMLCLWLSSVWPESLGPKTPNGNLKTPKKTPLRKPKNTMFLGIKTPNIW